MKYRVSIEGLALFVLALLVLAYFVFELGIFLSEDQMGAPELASALNQTLLVGTVLITGLLGISIWRYRTLKSEMKRRVAAEGKARELAYQDSLTGLPNRRQFEEALAQAVATPPETGQCHAIFLLDLNGFKQINDTFGHGIGDEALIIVAQRLLGAVRDTDLVARLGGDEFVVLARHMLGPDAATGLALRLLAALEVPVATGKGEHRMGAGIGIAMLPIDADTASEALRKADVALYRAKAERRSTFRFFESDMDRLITERGQMERELEDAIRTGAIEPRFHPSLDLATGRVIGFEIVPVWVTATGTEIPAERFLAIAEENGLVHDLASNVLEKACFAAAQWPQGVTLSMNVLPGQIGNRDLGKTILAILERTGFDPARLEIEIAENIIVLDLEAAKLALAPLREAGVRIALDSFGTGYSNLYHMREFRIDKVKIARRLIENIAEADTDRMVRALAGLGRGLGIAVSAEGMTAASLGATLLDAGIGEAQKEGSRITAEEAARLAAAS